MQKETLEIGIADHGGLIWPAPGDYGRKEARDTFFLGQLIHLGTRITAAGGVQ